MFVITTSHLRTFGPPVAALAFGVVGALVGRLPFLIAGGALLVGGALVGTLRVAPKDYALAIRSVLLAVSALGYPFFFGGIVAALAIIAHAALIIVGWFVGSRCRACFTTAQALAVALAVCLAAAAAQFFFPTVWRWSALSIILALLVLAVATTPGAIESYLPSPATAVGLLIISEGFLLLRFLPMHWIVNGVLLALVSAAALERERWPRMAYGPIAAAVILLGVM
ncbi:MAG: hypothetical protein V1723_03335 [Candidatus Uhrbacteria bacterium]